MQKGREVYTPCLSCLKAEDSSLCTSPRALQTMAVAHPCLSHSQDRSRVIPGLLQAPRLCVECPECSPVICEPQAINGDSFLPICKKWSRFGMEWAQSYPYVFPFNREKIKGKKAKWFCLYCCLNGAVAAAKSLQLGPTLCDPIDGSLPGSSIPGILQARILEQVSISYNSLISYLLPLLPFANFC